MAAYKVREGAGLLLEQVDLLNFTELAQVGFDFFGCDSLEIVDLMQEAYQPM